MKTFSREDVISNIFLIFLTFRDFRLIGSNSNVSFRVDSYSNKTYLDWEKIIANEATDKGLISKIYKQPLKFNSRKINDPIKK